MSAKAAYLIKRVVQKTAAILPRSVNDVIEEHYSATNLECCLRKLSRAGFMPTQIVDCGAFEGAWTRLVKQLFPAARVLMIDAQPDKEALLAATASQFPDSVEYELCLLGPEPREAVNFYEVKSGGSSILRELSNAPAQPRTLRMRTLDEVLKKRGFREVSYMKLDLQGFETEVLKGAATTLRTVELIQMEVSLVQYNEGAPLFGDVVNLMKEKGFVLYELCDFKRWRSGILFQVDAFFVRVESRLRKVDFIYGC